MARHEHLPIYRSAMKLAVHLENTVRGLPRYVKYTLGSDMRLNGQQIVGLIVRANSQRNRFETLCQLRAAVESLLVQARICQETGGFRSFAAFAAIVELAGDVIRQNDGLWSIPCDTPAAQQLRGIMASYFGHFSWADTRRLRRSTFDTRYPWLSALFRLDHNGMPRQRFKRRHTLLLSS